MSKPPKNDINIISQNEVNLSNNASASREVDELEAEIDKVAARMRELEEWTGDIPSIVRKAFDHGYEVRFKDSNGEPIVWDTKESAYVTGEKREAWLAKRAEYKDLKKNFEELIDYISSNPRLFR